MAEVNPILPVEVTRKILLVNAFLVCTELDGWCCLLLCSMLLMCVYSGWSECGLLQWVRVYHMLRVNALNNISGQNCYSYCCFVDSPTVCCCYHPRLVQQWRNTTV